MWMVYEGNSDNYNDLYLLLPLALVFDGYGNLTRMFMNIIKIVVALICAYGLFVSVAYMLMRLLFPKIEINEANEKELASSRRTIRKLNRTAVRRQKNLAY